MENDCGDRFQAESRYRRGALPRGRMDPRRRPEFFKRYPDAPRVPLPPAASEGGAPLWQTIGARESVRRFAESSLAMAELSQLLWATQGVTHRLQEFELRAAPSAGALYPIETYVVAHRVEELAAGVYHYAVGEHALEQLRAADVRKETARAALDQGMAGAAPCVFAWSAVFERSKWKYLQRAYRYIYLDAGHIAQNLALAAVGLGLGSCQIAALYDEEANALIGLDGDHESVIYMSTVGRPA